MPATQAYWDGMRWTDHVAPMQQYVRPMPTTAPDGLIAAGWVLTFLMPLIGLVIGIVVLAKGSEGHGIGQIIVSGVIITLLLAANGYA